MAGSAATGRRRALSAIGKNEKGPDKRHPALSVGWLRLSRKNW